MLYAIDSDKQQMAATGVVEAVYEWADTPGGQRRPTDTQARSETGVLLWQVEIIYSTESYGRPATVVARVSVPAATEPAPKAMAPVRFVGLMVEVAARRNGGGIRESWRAAGIEAAVSPKSGAPS